MNLKTFKQIRALVFIFVAGIVSFSIIQNSYILAVAGVLTGMIFLVAVRSKTKISVDEREIIVREKAAQAAYAIFAPTIGIGAFLLLFPSKSGLSVFSKGEFLYLESLGMVLAYLALFLIVLYAISYYYFNKKFGGGRNED